MKKILAFLLVVAMLCSFAACVANPDTTTTQNPGTTNSDTTTAPDDQGEPEDPWAAYEPITIAEALELCGEVGNVTEERYYIVATITSVTDAQYGAMTIVDETGSISVYGTYSADGAIGYAEMEDRPYKGDTVLLHCILQNYNGTKEVKNARLIDFRKAQVEIDPSEYTQMSIAQARNTAVGTKVKVEGVVARITYADGMKPNGVVLVDNTGSIYIYDGDLAGRVSIGNQISVAASKTMWILESEMTNASKFGYQGCNQLEDATLIENDEADHEFDKSWITESTVKEIMDHPVSEDITTIIYKVTALVNRVEGKGFTNYYINDLDGTTGSYTYTQCSGSDFAWLDEFDGKICTVYLMALNCKSAAAGCTYRFLPVAVEDEGFVFDTNNAAEHAVKYYGVGQFQSSYSGDPALKLIDSVSSELLGFENATLSYTSSDSSVISVTDGVMHCHKSGTAQITVTGEYNGKRYEEKVTISVEMAEQIDAGNVKSAIDAAVGEKVTIRGIVAASLVNKTGFYIIDETGVIAVLTDAETLETLKLGNEIVIEGERAFEGKNDSVYCTTCLKNATVVANYYGEHEYSTATFISGKTLADFAALSVKEDHTTEVYVVKATIDLVETNFYTSIKLVDGSVSVNLYCSSANQYNFLKQFAGQEVTLELAPCNWSSKDKSYPACALAVYLENGEKIVNSLNFD